MISISQRVYLCKRAADLYTSAECCLQAVLSFCFMTENTKRFQLWVNSRVNWLMTKHLHDFLKLGFGDKTRKSALNRDLFYGSYLVILVWRPL